MKHLVRWGDVTVLEKRTEQNWTGRHPALNGELASRRRGHFGVSFALGWVKVMEMHGPTLYEGVEERRDSQYGLRFGEGDSEQSDKRPR